MISQGAIQGLEARGLEYTDRSGRRQREVTRSVLGRAGRYEEVAENFRVKEVRVDDRRYIVCYNPQEVSKDAEEREAIVKALQDQLHEGTLQLVGNRGYRRFLRWTRMPSPSTRRRLPLRPATMASG
ncbi:MAG: hypothetical protein Q8O40_15950 [Chloroflexota bacterium]|nr:hypothetical protein [Chloroflexota bacterium]